MSGPTRPAYKGLKPGLVVAFDVGTTYSGISYSVLEPGKVPEITGVTKFPAQIHISGAAKIPTIIYYDVEGKVRAVGAEATKEGVQEMAEEEDWIKADWFKLHLRSREGAAGTISSKIPPLPPNKTVIEVFADYLKYLLECASTFIQDTHPNGREFWKSVKDSINFVLSHPNGWEGAQQDQMRQAAALANLIPDTEDGHARVVFVTEGEASFHYVVQNGLPPGALKDGEGVAIVDAGGGTIDISSYSKKVEAAEEIFKEIAVSQCHFYGSVFVTIHAEVFLQNFLAESSFVHDLDHIIRCFDTTTKHRFQSSEDPQYIKFGLKRDNDDALNIRFGQLKLKGSDVTQFFQPSIDCIIRAVVELQKAAHKPIRHIVLVGGFAANDFLFGQVYAALSTLGLNVLRPTNHVGKAVSDGAVSFYLDHFVQARVSKLTYGVFADVEFDPEDPDHRDISRQHEWLDGCKRINDKFDIILPKNTRVSETTEFRQAYAREFDSSERHSISFFESIFCYRGPLKDPKWQDTDPDNYTQLCRIKADLNHLPLTPLRNGFHKYFEVRYEIILLFGLTELKAQIGWMENGVEKRTTPKVIYDPAAVKHRSSQGTSNS